VTNQKQTQISIQADQRLNLLSRQIHHSEEKIEQAIQDKDQSWEMVMGVFDEFDLAGAERRFIADDGFYLYLQERNSSPKLDEEKLHALIFQNYSPAKANRIWNSITTQKIDTTKLEAAQQLGKIDANLINQCIKPGTKSFARIHNEWTKDDRERAAIFGIEKKD
jgi:hypothetical protein